MARRLSPAPRGLTPATRSSPGPVPLLGALAAALLLAGCALPRWPVEGTITSGFGIRSGGILPDLHRGVDIRVPVGTPIHPMAAGRIRYAGAMRGYGMVVWVDHDPGLLTVYAHLSTLQVQAGQGVGRGDILGLSGQSGDASGPHLHFEIWRWGREVDPVPFLGGPPGGP